jgi:hypothetical protein
MIPITGFGGNRVNQISFLADRKSTAREGKTQEGKVRKQEEGQERFPNLFPTLLPTGCG